MTVFKAFLRILNHNKWVIILYSVILVIFSAFSLETAQTSTTFESTRPDIHIINHDTEEGITGVLIDYLTEHSNIIELPDTPDAVSDALFYRNINYVIEIPSNFHADFLAGLNPPLDVRSSGDYNASLAEMNLTRFLNIANQYLLVDQDEAELLAHLEHTLDTKVEVELVSTLDTGNLDRAAFYYNFANYPIIMGCIYIISTVMLSFRDSKVSRRIAMGDLTPRRLNRILLGANALFALVLWAIYVVISFFIVGTTMFSLHGLWFMIDSFVFTICIASLAFLVANIIRSRNAINGITNVIGLGSSFLCGAFIPLVWLPSSVIAFAHVLPSYWYISANDQVKRLETFTTADLTPILLHLLVLLGFTAAFAIATNIISARRSRR